MGLRVSPREAVKLALRATESTSSSRVALGRRPGSDPMALTAASQSDDAGDHRGSLSTSCGLNLDVTRPLLPSSPGHTDQLQSISRRSQLNV